MTDATSPALFYVSPLRGELREAPLGEGALTLRMHASAISRGTERLVFEGRVPESEHARMRAPFQQGEFPFPVKYGYCAVAEVIDGPDPWKGRMVFALHPHQALFRLPVSACHPLPEGLPIERATLAANMETALTVLWDSGVSAGDRVAVIGAGVVGCLVARLAGRIPGVEVTLCDTIAAREAVATELGVSFARAGEMPQEMDVAVNASASAAGLAAALDCLGPEGRAVEASWHGAGETPVPLGGAFHSRRLTLVSSQVGRIPPARAPRWDYARRLALALRLLAEDPALDRLLSQRVDFEILPLMLPRILLPPPEGRAPPLCSVVRYPGALGRDD